MRIDDVIGQWVHECQLKLSDRAFARVNAALTFVADGTAVFEERYTTVWGDAEEPGPAKRTVVQWTLTADQLHVDIPGRLGSPFAFSKTPSGDLQWYNGGLWRRSAQER